MTRLAIRSLWARKVRAFATSLAVVLGVAFIAGSYVLTDTIFAAFDEIFSESLKGTAVVVTAQNPVKQEGGEVPTIPASYLPKVQKVAGVKEAAGAIFTPGGFFNSEGNAVGTKFAPKFISSTLPKDSSRSPTSTGTGRAGRAKPRSTRRGPKRPGSRSATR